MDIVKLLTRHNVLSFLTNLKKYVFFFLVRFNLKIKMSESIILLTLCFTGISTSVLNVINFSLLNVDLSYPDIC